MSKRALIFYGGWDGHEPERMAKLFAAELTAAGFAVTVDADMNRLAAADELAKFAVIVPCWTRGEMTSEQAAGLQTAVREQGVGFVGVHGGSDVANRADLSHKQMIGGRFVGHPYVGEYEVRRAAARHELSALIPEKFSYRSEQYYLLVDPGVTVLAETTYAYEDRRCVMPVVWVKTWGRGRVFYSALGHLPREFVDYPAVREFTVAGMLWAAK